MTTYTLTLAYLYCEFAFLAHFQCVVRTYDLNCIESSNQLVSMQGKILEYSFEIGSVSALTNQMALLEKLILKCIDSVIGKSSLKLEIFYIIVRKTILFLNSLFYFTIKSF